MEEEEPEAILVDSGELRVDLKGYEKLTGKPWVDEETSRKEIEKVKVAPESVTSNAFTLAYNWTNVTERLVKSQYSFDEFRIYTDHYKMRVCLIAVVGDRTYSHRESLHKVRSYPSLYGFVHSFAEAVKKHEARRLPPPPPPDPPSAEFFPG